MAQTFITNCSNGSQQTIGEQIITPSGSNVIQVGGECFAITGYGPAEVGDPIGLIQGYYETCDECRVAAAEGAYRLTNCENPLDIIETLTPGIASYTFQTIKLNGKCYSILPVTPVKFQGTLTEIDLASPDLYTNCNACLNTYWKVTHCDGSGTVQYLPQNAYSSSDGNVVKVAGICRTIEKVLTGEVFATIPDAITETFGIGNCASCQVGTFFRLDMCNEGFDEPVYILEDDPGSPLVFETHHGKIIKVNINGQDTCWLVTRISRSLSTASIPFPGALISVHENCLDCAVVGTLPDTPTDIEAATRFDLTEGQAPCNTLKFTNLTILYNQALYSELVLPELYVTFPSGVKLVFDSTTVLITDGTKIASPFDPLNPSTPFEITIEDIQNNIADGVLVDAEDNPIPELTDDFFSDGIYEVTFGFYTQGLTTGYYSFTDKYARICNIKDCYTKKAQDYLDTGCGSGCNDSVSEAQELVEIMILIDAIRYNMDLKKYDCAQIIIDALSEICETADCGCLR